MTQIVNSYSEQAALRQAPRKYKSGSASNIVNMSEFRINRYGVIAGGEDVSGDLIKLIDKWKDGLKPDDNYKFIGILKCIVDQKVYKNRNYPFNISAAQFKALMALKW